MRLSDELLTRHPTPAPRHAGWHELSRRSFLRGIGGTAGGALAVKALGALPALAAPAGTVEPVPIPGGIVLGGTLFHVFLPGVGAEPSTITDFKGFSGVGVVQGDWTATGSPTGGVASGVWEADMRFMKGTFIGSDGTVGLGTFAFT